MKTKLSILITVFFALFFLATCQNESAVMSEAGGDQKINTKIAPPYGQTLPNDISKFRINYSISEFQITLDTEFDLIEKSANLRAGNTEGVNCNLTFTYSDETLEELKTKISELRYSYSHPNLGNDNRSVLSGGCGNSSQPDYALSPAKNGCIYFAFDVPSSSTIDISESTVCSIRNRYFESGTPEFINLIYSLLSEQEDIGTCPENWDLAFDIQE